MNLNIMIIFFPNLYNKKRKSLNILIKKCLFENRINIVGNQYLRDYTLLRFIKRIINQYFNMKRQYL